MGKTIRLNLSLNSIRQAQRELLAYKEHMLQNCQRFVEALSELGITTATQNVSDVYGPYILFETEVTDIDKCGARAVMYATNTGLIKSEWRTSDGVKSADVSPILMEEFGAGLLANNPDAGKFGMGTGTFPGQTHAEDPEGWWYMDLNYEWHHSDGVAPTMPMAHAAEDMIENVIRVAREVFGT